MSLAISSCEAAGKEDRTTLLMDGSVYRGCAGKPDGEGTRAAGQQSVFDPKSGNAMTYHFYPVFPVDKLLYLHTRDQRSDEAQWHRCSLAS
jgi:hypothetical protein